VPNRQYFGQYHIATRNNIKSVKCQPLSKLLQMLGRIKYRCNWSSKGSRNLMETISSIIEVILSSSNKKLLEVRSLHSNLSFCLINVYAPTKPEEKIWVWNELQSQTLSKPNNKFILGGDFRVLLTIFEDKPPLKYQFKFKKMWFKREDLVDLIQQRWSELVNGPRIKKSFHIKSKLKDWNKKI
jgi:hypothetical protein